MSKKSIEDSVRASLRDDTPLRDLMLWLGVDGLPTPLERFLAVRDYAMVYYALFFFLVQHMGRHEGARFVLSF